MDEVLQVNRPNAVVRISDPPSRFVPVETRADQAFVMLVTLSPVYPSVTVATVVPPDPPDLYV